MMTEFRRAYKAKLAAKMKKLDSTNREISKALGIPVDLVPSRIRLGDRLLYLESLEKLN